jgi:hypothetical protein
MNREMDELEDRVVRALEAAPKVAIPEGFALRVAAQVPAGVRAARREIRASDVGGRMAVVVAAMLLVALVVLGRFGPANETMQWLEIGLAIEFAGLMSWLGLRPMLRSR